MNYGNYFISDTPQQLATYFKDYFMIDSQQVQLLFSVYSLPAAAMAFLGGFIVNWMTPFAAAMATTYIIFLAAAIISLGVYLEKYWVLVAGRFLYGVAGEPCMIAQHTLAAYWFNGKFLSFSTGLIQTINNLGFMSSNITIPISYSVTRSMMVPFFLAACSCLISVAASIGYSLTEIFFKEKEKDPAEELASGHAGELHIAYAKDMLNWRTILGIFNVALGCQLYFRFDSMSQELIMNTFDYTLLEAKNFTIIPPMTAIIFTQVYSIVAVRLGKKSILICSSYIIAIFAYAMLYLMPQRSSRLLILAMFLMGQFWSIYAATAFSSMALITPTRSVALAFGFSLFMNNVLGFFFPLYFGKLINSGTRDSYKLAILSLMLIGTLCLLNSLAFGFIDLRQGGMLHYRENGIEVYKLRSIIQDKIRSQEKGKGYVRKTDDDLFLSGKVKIGQESISRESSFDSNMIVDKIK